MEAQKRARLTYIMNQIKKNGNLAGVLFSDREGNLIAENLGIPFDQSNFSSMCASVLESASGLGRASGDRKLIKIIAELENQTIIILECDDKTFLTLFVNYDSNIRNILTEIDKYIKKLILLYELKKKF